MIKWIPNAWTKCDSMIGSKGAPIGYVCEKPDYSNPPPDFMQMNGTFLPFPEDCGYVSAALIQRMDHNHPQFKEDSSTLYDKIVESFTGTPHASALKKLKKKKNGFDFGKNYCLI